MSTALLARHRVVGLPFAAGYLGLLAWRLGPGPELLLAALWACVLVAVALADVEQGIIPDAIILPASGVALAASLPGWPAHADRLLAGVLAALVFLLIRAAAGRHYGREALGLGDVKLVLFIGLALGFGPGLRTLWALVAGAVLAGAVAAFLLARGRAGPDDSIPYGPFLSAGALAVLLLLR